MVSAVYSQSFSWFRAGLCHGAAALMHSADRTPVSPTPCGRRVPRPGDGTHAGPCPRGRDLGGHLVHTPSKSRNPSRTTQCPNKIQIQLLLMTRGCAKQRALLWVINLRAWQLPGMPSRSTVTLALMRTSLHVIKLSRMKFGEILHHSWP